MNIFEKSINVFCLLWSAAFLVVTKRDLNAINDGVAVWLSQEQYEQFWFVSLIVIIIGVVTCFRDSYLRFEDKNLRHKWYVLLVLFATFTYPYYFFKYGLKPRQHGV